MNKKKIPAIIIFNAVLILADIALLSKGLLGLEGTEFGAAVTASVIAFFLGNYLLLSSAFKKPSLRDKDVFNIDECETALKGWKSMNTPFGLQIETALKQLEQLESRKAKLKAINDDNSFDSAVDEVQSNILKNFKRIVNKFIVCDQTDPVDVKSTAEYVNSVLVTNGKYLDVLKKFIDEISMMTDMSDPDAKTLSLQLITESLRELRKNGDS